MTGLSKLLRDRADSASAYTYRAMAHRPKRVPKWARDDLIDRVLQHADDVRGICRMVHRIDPGPHHE